MQCDSRGQIVIPKEVREELGVEEGSGFWMFVIEKEGVLLKKIGEPKLEEDNTIVHELKEKAGKIGISKDNLSKSAKRYIRKKKGRLEEI